MRLTAQQTAHILACTCEILGMTRASSYSAHALTTANAATTSTYWLKPNTA